VNRRIDRMERRIEHEEGVAAEELDGRIENEDGEGSGQRMSVEFQGWTWEI